MRRFVTFGPAFVVLLTTVVALFAAPAVVRRVGFASTAATVELAQQGLDGDDILRRLNQAVRNVADAVEPSVVHIAVNAPSRRWGMQRVSQGSGWVFDSQGNIVTNAHVVRSAPSIAVQFHDGRVADAEIVGVDLTTDIAVIRAKTDEGLFPARRATGEMLEQGDRVFAFGSPFGFKFSMSEGIVSGLGRDPQGIIGNSGYTNFIQTDAAVNPGNSGGPLVDISGRVVGMNVAIATGSSPQGTSEGQSSGISFAIPLDTIENVAEQLIAHGAVSKGYLGIEHPGTEEQNRDRLAAIGFTGRGVIVNLAQEGGPAATAGLRAGDVITRFRNRAVNSVAELRSLITNNRPGETVAITVWRDGATVELSVTLADLTQTQNGKLLTVEALQAFGFIGPVDVENGVFVDSLRTNSQAISSGLRPGQTVVAVDGKTTKTIDDLLTQLSEAGFANGRKVTLTIVGADGDSSSLAIQYRP